MKMLITGGTQFVSRFVAEYFVAGGHEVWVLNRNTRPQSAGVRLIACDRHALGDRLKGQHFDAVLDATAYTGEDVDTLLDALDSFDDYVLISSSAVYPETLPQPFREDQPCGPNRVWGAYGTDKLAAERCLTARVPRAYSIRPPYLYGPMNNVYREAFAFECAEKNLPFYVPGTGSMPLQFFHVADLCRFVETLLARKPKERIFNVGNPQTVTVCQWAELCYGALGKTPEIRQVQGHPQRSYFSFYDYAYKLDVSRQSALMPQVKPMEEGLREAYAWYRQHRDLIARKNLLEYIGAHIR